MFLRILRSQEKKKGRKKERTNTWGCVLPFQINTRVSKSWDGQDGSRSTLSFDSNNRSQRFLTHFEFVLGEHENKESGPSTKPAATRYLFKNSWWNHTQWHIFEQLWTFLVQGKRQVLLKLRRECHKAPTPVGIILWESINLWELGITFTLPWRHLPDGFR